MTTSLTFSSYVPQAIQTESPPKIVFTNQVSEDHVVIGRLLHACLGLTTEMVEFSKAETPKNAHEEFGDIFWYVAVIYSAIKTYSVVELLTIYPDYDKELAKNQDLNYWVGEINDVIKRVIFYGETLQDVNKKGWRPMHRIAMCFWGIMRWIEECLSEKGLLMEEPHGVEIGGDPTALKSWFLGRVIQHDENEFYEIMGYKLDDYSLGCYTLDGKKHYCVLRLMGKPETPPVLQLLDYSLFKVTVADSLKTHGDILNFGSHFFSALSDYYSRQGCETLNIAYKAGYTTLMAMRPDQTNDALKNIWAIIAVWGPLHRLGIPKDLMQLEYMLSHPKELCLCPSSVRK